MPSSKNNDYKNRMVAKPKCTKCELQQEKVYVNLQKRNKIIQRLVDNGWRKLRCHTTIGLVRFIKNNRFICTVDALGNYSFLGIREVKH